MVGLAKLLADAWTRCRFWSHRALLGRRWCRGKPQVPQVSQCRLRICRSVPLPLRSAARGTIWGSRCHRHRVGVYHPAAFAVCARVPGWLSRVAGVAGVAGVGSLPPGRPSGRPPARSMVGGREGAVATSAHRRSGCYIARRRSAGHYTTTRICRRHRCRRRSAGSRRNAGRCSDARVAPRRAHGVRVSAEVAAAAPVPQCARQARSSHSRAQYSRVRTVLRWCCYAVGATRTWRWVGDVVQVVAIRTCRSRCTPS